MDALVEVRGLTVDYGPVRAVRGIDLDVRRSEIVALIGANGAGKSSTLNAIMGLVTPAAGSVTFADGDVTGSAPESIVRRGMTMAPEGRRVFARLSVEENLLLGAVGGASRGIAAEVLDSVLDRFPLLAERRHQLAGTLSGGEQQQLAIGRALMSQPSVLLLDEPSLGLAPIMVDVVFDLVAELPAAGVTVVLVEQAVEQTLEIADRAYVLSAGSIEMAGSAADLRGDLNVLEAYLGVEAASR